MNTSATISKIRSALATVSLGVFLLAILGNVFASTSAGIAFGETNKSSAALVPAAPLANLGEQRQRFNADEQNEAADDSRAGKKTLRGKLNINTATTEQLQLLPGIGPAKAQRIIEFRQKQGKFRRTRDIRRIKGIGYKTFKRLEPHLSTDGPTTLTVE